MVFPVTQAPPKKPPQGIHKPRLTPPASHLSAGSECLPGVLWPLCGDRRPASGMEPTGGPAPAIAVSLDGLGWVLTFPLRLRGHSSLRESRVPMTNGKDAPTANRGKEDAPGLRPERGMQSKGPSGNFGEGMVASRRTNMS